MKKLRTILSFSKLVVAKLLTANALLMQAISLQISLESSESARISLQIV